MNSFTITDDGVLVFTNGVKPYTVDPTHVNYTKIITAIKGRKFKVAAALTEQTAVKQSIQKLSTKISIVGGQVLFNGQPVGGIVVERILKFVREGLPYKPLVRFIERLQMNPSSRAVQELYTFLEHKKMPITEDGCFIGYKAIRNDWTDKHTGKFNNSIGETPNVPRNSVDDDFEVGCSTGLHIGSWEYAQGFASGDDRIVLVKVDPADAVCVPKDCDFQKLRSWRYKVIAEAPREPLNDELYGDVQDEDDALREQAEEELGLTDAEAVEAEEDDCCGFDHDDEDERAF